MRGRHCSPPCSWRVGAHVWRWGVWQVDVEGGVATQGAARCPGVCHDVQGVMALTCVPPAAVVCAHRDFAEQEVELALTMNSKYVWSPSSAVLVACSGEQHTDATVLLAVAGTQSMYCKAWAPTCM